MKSICLFTMFTFSLIAFANTNPEAEIDRLAGDYVLTKEVQGNCPASVKVVKYSATGFGIGGDQPGDVIAQITDVNTGMKTHMEINPMTGTLNGWTNQTYTVGKGVMESSYISRWPGGKERYHDNIKGTFDGVHFKFRREYDGRGFNDICFVQDCEYYRTH